MTHTRRDFLKFSAAGFCALVLPSASYSLAAGSSEALSLIKRVQELTGGNNVTLRVLYPEGSLPNLKPVADAFLNVTGVGVEFIEMTVNDINTKILIDATREKSDFDLALPATFGIPDLAEAGALADISDYAARYEPLYGYTASLYDLGDSYKEKKYGYQTDGDVYMMFYNREWLEDEAQKQRFLEEYGKPIAVPKTWEELDILMEFFHQPEEERYGGNLFRTPSYMVWEFWIRMHAMGVMPFDDDMRCNLASAASKNALKALIGAGKYQHPSAIMNGLFDNWEVYAKGNCFANIGWGGTQKYLNNDDSHMKGKMIHAATPQVSYFNWGWNYVVSRFSEQQEIAYLFSLFATSPKMSLVAVKEEGFFDPYREEHYDDKAVQKAYSPEFLAAHKSAMTEAIPDLYIEGRGRYMEVLEKAIQSTHEGYVNEKEALTFVAKEWDKITDDIGRDSQIKQWKLLKSQYPKSFEAG